jgi:C-terminal processing protease CtpA/Prc
MKKSFLLALLAVPALVLAQSNDSSDKPKPVEPVLAQFHSGPGRIGVRLAFAKDTGMPTIIGLTRGGPASDAGFLIGDVIIKIDKNYTNTLTQDEVKLALHGDPGIGVELTVQRQDDPKLIVRAVDRRILTTEAEEVVPSTKLPETVFPDSDTVQ